MCDTVRVSNRQCLEAEHFFHEACLFYNQAEGSVVCYADGCKNSCQAGQIIRGVVEAKVVEQNNDTIDLHAVHELVKVGLPIEGMAGARTY